MNYTYTVEQAKTIVDRYNERVKQQYWTSDAAAVINRDYFDDDLFADGKADVEIREWNSLSGRTELIRFYVSDFEPLEGSE